MPRDPVTSLHHNRVGQFVHETYLLPAKARGDPHVTVHVHEVWKALDCVYSPYFIREALESPKFRDSYGVSFTEPYPDLFFPESFTFRLDAANIAA